MVRRVTDLAASTLVCHRLRWTMAAASVLSGFLLYHFPPETYPFYPPCPIHQLTGLLCPGCGATRAIAALLHGHLHRAYEQNALVVFLLPLFAVWLPLSRYDRDDGSNGRGLTLSPGVIALLVTAAVLFAVSRNVHFS